MFLRKSPQTSLDDFSAKRQAPSAKRQAPSAKRQAPSAKRQALVCNFPKVDLKTSRKDCLAGPKAMPQACEKTVEAAIREVGEP